MQAPAQRNTASRVIDKRELLLASLDKQFFFSKRNRDHVVSSLCGLQAQFANNPAHALRIRADDFTNHDWHTGLVKTWTFRHTLHAVRRDEINLFISAVGFPAQWDVRWGLNSRTQALWAGRLREWIREGITDREALKNKCREKKIRQDVLDIVFHGWGGVIKEMCKRGMIAYEPGTAKRFVACDEYKPMDRDTARIEILRRYFTHLGPATMQDCANFTGFSKKTVLQLLHDHPLPLQSVHCEGEDYFYMEEWNTSHEIPKCLFLSGFDQMHLAYRDRSRLVDEQHKQDVVTNTGIIHPTILVDGRVKAKWKKDGTILRITPFAPLAKRTRKHIAATGERLFNRDITQVIFTD